MASAIGQGLYDPPCQLNISAHAPLNIGFAGVFDRLPAHIDSAVRLLNSAIHHHKVAGGNNKLLLELVLVDAYVLRQLFNQLGLFEGFVLLKAAFIVVNLFSQLSSGDRKATFSSHLDGV